MSDKTNTGKKGAAPGQAKTHLVQDAAGNQFEMTQSEWKNRDKSAGLTRVDAPDADEATEEPSS